VAFKLLFKEEARAEITEAFNWYEFQSVGLGLKFRKEVDNCLKRIEINPTHFQVVHNNLRH
jgi:hypothetical protein